VLLLDTHVWVWVVEGNESQIGRRTRRMLEKAESREDLRISAVTVFEIAALHTAGRLRLGLPLEEWIHRACDVKGLRLAEFSSSIAVDAGRITRMALPDPLDRLLITTAQHFEATFLTADQQILDYASDTRNVRVHNVRS
jgi:PIN domain nuclease of toxin-antitoxin system